MNPDTDSDTDLDTDQVLVNKIEKYSAEISSFIFLKKYCNFLIPRMSKLQEKPSARKKEHPAFQKMIFLPLDCSLFSGAFFPSWNRRIRIQGSHWIRVQSGSTTMILTPDPVFSANPDPKFNIGNFGTNDAQNFSLSVALRRGHSLFIIAFCTGKIVNVFVSVRWQPAWRLYSGTSSEILTSWTSTGSFSSITCPVSSL